MSERGEARPVIEVRAVAGLWRMTSSDGRLSGAFTDRQAAIRYARDEAACHPDYGLRLPSA